jgi:hypothetical protein
MPKKETNNIISLHTIAIAGAIGKVCAAIIGAITTNYRVEILGQSAEQLVNFLGKILLISGNLLNCFH